MAFRPLCVHESPPTAKVADDGTGKLRAMAVQTHAKAATERNRLLLSHLRLS